MSGKNIVTRVQELAEMQQNGSYTDGPGYNDHSGNPDHNRGTD